MAGPPPAPITILCADNAGTVPLVQRLGARAQAMLAAQQRVLADVCQARGGRVLAAGGDAAEVAFDHALDAALAAADAQRALTDHPWPEGVSPRVRVGLHTSSPPDIRGEAGTAGEAAWAAAWAAGQVLLPDAAGHLARELGEDSDRDTPPLPGPAATPIPPARLSEREAEVLGRIAAGRSNREIADELGISERTVNRHITNLYTKLDARNRAEAVAFALRHGLA